MIDVHAPFDLSFEQLHSSQPNLKTPDNNIGATMAVNSDRQTVVPTYTGHHMQQTASKDDAEDSKDSCSCNQIVSSLNLSMLMNRGLAGMNQTTASGDANVDTTQLSSHMPRPCETKKSVVQGDAARKIELASVPPAAANSSELQLGTEDSRTLAALLGNVSQVVASGEGGFCRSRLYPESIPPHRLHPCAGDFSVVDQGPIGKALLTHRSWQQGEFMARFDGMTVPEVMLHTLQKSQSIHLWDPHFIGNLAHSCNPNVMLDMAEHEMWAVQNIEPGAVLSMDYASTEDHLFRTFQCQCTAPGCRGEVTGRKQRRSSKIGDARAVKAIRSPIET